MKKGTKIGLGAGVLLLSTILLSGCTASFCSTLDKAHMMYAYDYGVSSYENDDSSSLVITSKDGNTTYTLNVSVTADLSNCVSLEGIIEDAQEEGITTPSLNYWAKFDLLVLRDVLDMAAADGLTIDADHIIAGPINDNEGTTKTTLVYDADGDGVITYDSKYDGNITNYGVLETDSEGNLTHDVDLLKTYGYTKFYYTTGVSSTHTAVRWENWENYNEELRADPELSIDELASDDFVSYYQSSMESLISSYRACLTLNDGVYGYYGASGEQYPVSLTGKSYSYAWSRGLFEGLLVWPIGALIDLITTGMLNAGVANGWAQILSIIIITILIRSIMLLFTFNQQASTAKMNELQPQLQKIQAKYPNANTSNVEKARLAEETQKLYKKNNVHPMRSILVMFIQFPIFICVWGALSGSAILSTGSFLGLNLSESVSSVLFTSSGWSSFTAGGPMALILFILMALTQTASMLLPQFIQKRKAKKAPKLGKNPSQSQNQKFTKIFSIVMLVMIIIMGFSLASGMVVYWIITALFSAAQTLITQSIMSRKSGKKKEKKVK